MLNQYEQYKDNKLIMDLVFLGVCAAIYLELKLPGVFKAIFWEFIEGLAAVKG